MTTTINSSQAFHMEILERKAHDLFTYVDKFSSILSRDEHFNDGLGPERATQLWDSIQAVEYTLPRLANAAKNTTSENE